jgi:RimJ/RimL family protein N-acetyltransferase
MDTRVSLRPVVEADEPTLFAYQNDAEASAMAAFPVRDREAHAAHWKKILANPAVCARAILYGDEVAGNVGAFDMDGARLVGYWIGRAFWGRGIASRALALFLNVEKTRPLNAWVAKHNLGSIRVLEKNGFVKVGEGVIPPDKAGADDEVEEWRYRLE